MNVSGVSLGDWASVTNPATGKTFTLGWKTGALPAAQGRYHKQRLLSVGISYLPNSDTIGNPTVVVQAFAGTASIERCSAHTLATNL